MINIRLLKESDLNQVVELRIQSWTEELAGQASNDLSEQEELAFWTNWYNTADENNDIRLLIGAFDGDKMLGVAIGSLAETSDIPKNGIELNGYWVYPQHRNRGVGLILLEYLLDYYKKIGMERIVIYNLHHSPSNTFYHKFGCNQVDQVYQMQGKLLVDIFNIEIHELLVNIGNSLEKYKLLLVKL